MNRATKPLSPARLKWWIAICVAFTFLAPAISIGMGVTLHAREMTYPGPGNITLFNGRTVCCSSLGCNNALLNSLIYDRSSSRSF